MHALDVHLVGGGTDVVALIAPLATVVVAGIGYIATARNTRKSLDAAAETQRQGISATQDQALRAEKLTAYSEYLSAVHQCIDARLADPPNLANEAKAIIDATNAVTVVQLIAPPDVAELATRVMRALLEMIPQFGTDHVTTLEGDLNRAMRKDLHQSARAGVPAPPAGGAAAQ
jgi:hypothetical protein